MLRLIQILRRTGPLLFGSCLCLGAQTPSANTQVPLRSLGAEMASATDGVTAYIHTDFATGTGLLLPNGVEVVVARHTVLTPDGAFAPQIGVGVPHAPLNNIVESRAIAEAQDPERDLVLLRIRTDAGGHPEPHAPLDTPHAAAAASAPTLVKGTVLKSGDAETASPVPVHRARLSRHGKRNASHGPRKGTATGAAPRSAVRLHIVTDGPASH